jgi:hypothetical protein
MSAIVSSIRAAGSLAVTNIRLFSKNEAKAN